MSYLRTSLLFAVGMALIGLGAAGGCADGASSLPNSSAFSGGSGGSNANGGLTILPPLAGNSALGGTGSSGTTTTSVVCDAGLKRCGPNCVDVLTNPLQCGDCGKPCPADARECVSGTCVCPLETHAVCDGICSDLRTDLSNCGACGNFCPADRVCSGGKCLCDPAKAANTECTGKCVDLKTDATHCGACNATSTPTCDAAQVCSDGVCASSCKDPTVKCGPKCANLQTDSAHCSACDTPCDATRMCAAATCVCATGRTLCGTSTCADLQNDSKNCGKCAAVCLPGTSCAKGVCMCNATATLCTVPAPTGAGGAGSKATTVCADLTQHHDHCGVCNKPCATLETCEASACACKDPYVTCGTALVCTDLQTNNANCGACGKACNAATEHCEAGACVCTAPFLNCGAGCVDTSKTPAHCGACNQPCTGNQLCSNSTCVSGDIRVYTKMQQLPAAPTTVSNSIAVSVRVCNVGSATASLKSATIKYWYSVDGAAANQIAVSYSSTLAGVVVSAAAVEPMRGETDYTLVATLPATASLGPGSAASPTCIEEIQLSVHASDTYINGYLVANDWSYLATSSFALNDKVTMYIGAAKMWGNEPQ